MCSDSVEERTSLFYVSRGEACKDMSVMRWLRMALLSEHRIRESSEVLPEGLTDFTWMAVSAEAIGASCTAGVVSSFDESCAFKMPSTSRPSGLKALLVTVIWYCTGGTPSCKSTKQCFPLTCTIQMW